MALLLLYVCMIMVDFTYSFNHIFLQANVLTKQFSQIPYENLDDTLWNSATERLCLEISNNNFDY